MSGDTCPGRRTVLTDAIGGCLNVMPPPLKDISLIYLDYVVSTTGVPDEDEANNVPLHFPAADGRG